MSGRTRSKQWSRTVAMKKEVCQNNEKTIPSSAATESQVNEPCYLLGDKPFFDIILSKSHVKYPVVVPWYITHVFPRVSVPMVLTHGGKSWNMRYDGSDSRHKFDYQGWRRFAADNNLKCDDACIFEVMESSSSIIRLRVVILRNVKYLPPELDDGNSLEKPIELD